jgi:DEAD/DEAH box helicase
MEALLEQKASVKAPAKTSQQFTTQDRDAASHLASALKRLVQALETLSDSVQSSTVTSLIDPSQVLTWLWETCTHLHETAVVPLEPASLIISVWEASQLANPDQQQAALFDLLGASDESIQVLMDLTPQLTQISKIPLDTILSKSKNGATNESASLSYKHEQEMENLQYQEKLWQEAMDAAQVASIMRAEIDSRQSTFTTGATHTVHRASDKKALKEVEKAERRAQQALKRAKEEGGGGADTSEWMMRIDQAATIGSGGLANKAVDLAALQASLLPEGSRQYYNQNRTLPKGAIVEERGNIRKVILPPAAVDQSTLHRRLPVTEVMDPLCAKAFAGSESLNPMQSTVFDVAYNHRDNMLVCAPTGAGKTNVAMLAVVAHFRDVGLIPGGRSIETGPKIVYIAPMKALAQEVVEKFSSKLKDLRLIVRELTGDMQLTRAEADSANIIVTTPEKWDVVTRKAGNEGNALGNQCGLLIIDEVHLVSMIGVCVCVCVCVCALLCTMMSMALPLLFVAVDDHVTVAVTVNYGTAAAAAAAADDDTVCLTLLIMNALIIADTFSTLVACR